MSHEATSWAFAQQGLASGTKFLLVAIANHADKFGVCFPGRKYLADDCCTAPKTVTDNMGKLEAAGLIARCERRRKNGSRTSDWIVLAPHAGATRFPMLDAPMEEFPSQVAALARSSNESSGYESCGDESGPGQVTFSGGPEPSVEPSVDRSAARARATLKFAGKPVDPEAWSLTDLVLEEYNRQTGRKWRLVTSGGQLSEAAKRIYGRVVTYPDLELEDHADIIRRTLASKWWGSEPNPGIGVIYGEKVFEDNIDRPGVPKNAKDAEKRERATRDREAIERVMARARGEEVAA